MTLRLAVALGAADRRNMGPWTLAFWSAAAAVAGSVCAAIAGEHASLVVAVPTRTGWVVCADKRVINPLRGTRDDDTKVHRIAPAAILATTGTLRFTEQIDGDTFVTRFSASDSVKRVVSTNTFAGTSEYLRALADAVVSDFNAYLSSIPQTEWPDIDESPDSALFQLPVFWMTRDGVPEMALLRLPWRRTLEAEIRQSRPDDQLRPAAFGNLRVWLEVVRGHRPEFDDVRRDAGIRRFVRDAYQRQAVSPREAEAFARRFILLTHQRLPVLQGGEPDVGPTADCLTVP